ncbi:phosphotransferase [Cohnella sp. 56]|uniref:phosphotransferase n=1 Tax=Cohnella sp. 56 TaxID=3113722 RepID=UPI0030E9EE4B
MRTETEYTLLRELIEAAEPIVGSSIVHASPVARGWLNRKWKIETAAGEVYLLKQYDRDRYGEDRVPALRTALSWQQRLYRAGFPCPQLAEREGQLLHRTGGGERFNLMAYIQGDVPQPGRLSQQQLREFGSAAGRLHRLLNEDTLTAETSPLTVLSSRSERLSRLDELAALLRTQGAAAAWQPQLDLHREAARSIDLAALASSPPGFAHRDLWTDNVLVRADGLAAVLDFDRLGFDYPEHDIARALMSCCYRDGHYDEFMESAWLDGYASERPLCESGIARAKILLYWVECDWWIRPDMLHELTGPPARFREELAWLAADFLSR